MRPDTEHPSESRRVDDLRGDRLNAIVGSLVRQHKRYFGRGPDHARAFMSGDTLVCVLDGVLTSGEQTLIAHDETDAVLEQRAATHRAMRAEVAADVEAQLGRRIRSFMTASDPEAGLMAEIFVLDRPAGEAEASADLGELPQAVISRRA